MRTSSSTGGVRARGRPCSASTTLESRKLTMRPPPAMGEDVGQRGVTNGDPFPTASALRKRKRMLYSEKRTFIFQGSRVYVLTMAASTPKTATSTATSTPKTTGTICLSQPLRGRPIRSLTREIRRLCLKHLRPMLRQCLGHVRCFHMDRSIRTKYRL